MSTFRFSGLVTARITYIDSRSGYRVYLSTPTTPARQGYTCFFHERSIPDGYPLRAVDAPETFDSVARVAVARAAYSDFLVECEDSDAFSYAHSWTSRPSYAQAGFNTETGDVGLETLADGLEHSQIHVCRTPHALGAWLADHPNACMR